jgi:spermidine synthase
VFIGEEPEWQLTRHLAAPYQLADRSKEFCRSLFGQRLRTKAALKHGPSKSRITKDYPAMRMGRGQRKIVHFFKGIGVSLARLTPVMRRRSSFGGIGLFRHRELGRVFVLNGEIQHVEAWAPLYHEPLVHLPASFVEQVNDVLILGGGTLYAASEALKYKSVRRVVVVDRNPLVTETVAQYYPHARACLKDHRFTLVQEDAYGVLARLRNQFDLVINDGADLLDVKFRGVQGGAGPNLFSVMAAALKPSGACADVVQRHLFERERILRTLQRFGQRSRVALSLVLLPEYHGVLHVLTIWGKRGSAVTQTPSRLVNTEQSRWARNPKSSPCVYYDPRFLRYYLYLPRYLRQALTIKRRAA